MVKRSYFFETEEVFRSHYGRQNGKSDPPCSLGPWVHPWVAHGRVPLMVPHQAGAGLLVRQMLLLVD